jgi:hypothetical protein
MFWKCFNLFSNPPHSSILWRRKTYATYFESPSAAMRRRRIRKTTKRKRSERLERLLLDLQSVPAPKLPALKPELAARPPPRSPELPSHLR